MMDLEKLAMCEKLLDVPSSITLTKLHERIEMLHKHLIYFMEKIPEYNLEEKAVVLNLLSRSNELIKRAFDMQLEQMNLTKEKLNQLFENAERVKTPESLALIESLRQLQAKFNQVSISMTKADSVLSKKAAPRHEVHKKGIVQKLSRSKWQKP